MEIGAVYIVLSIEATGFLKMEKEEGRKGGSIRTRQKASHGSTCLFLLLF